MQIRRVQQLASTVLVAVGLAFVPATAEAAAENCATVRDGWAKVNYAIGDSTSPWFDTAQGIGFKRKIQFHAPSGVIADRCVGGRATGEQATFFYANTYRIESCMRPTACNLTGWTNYSKRPEKPAGYRWPNQAAGLDPFYNIYRTWAL